MARPANLIIDADSHITEPPDVWTSRVPAKYREDVPRVIRQGTTDTWVLNDQRLDLAKFQQAGFDRIEIDLRMPARVSRVFAQRLD